MMTLKKELIVARGQDGEEEAALLDEDDEDLEAGGPAGGLDLDETFLKTFRAESTRATAVLCKKGHLGEALGGWVCSNVLRTEGQARAALRTMKDWAKGLHEGRADCGPADTNKEKLHDASRVSASSHARGAWPWHGARAGARPMATGKLTKK